MNYFKFKVEKLKRVEYGPLKLGELEIGKIMEIKKEKVKFILKKNWIFQMRIISGSLKGRKLAAFNNKDIRPTSDRAKEMIFSTLYSILKKKSLEELKILDCFCGSGSLGIECISRGCQDVHFIDNSYESIEITRKNCKNMNIENFSKFYKSDFRNINLPALRVDLFFGSSL